MQFKVSAWHRSDLPHSISLTKGTPLTMREKCTGLAGWENGHYCKNDDHAGGWVPGQILEWPRNGNAETLENYTARELDVDEVMS